MAKRTMTTKRARGKVRGVRAVRAWECPVLAWASPANLRFVYPFPMNKPMKPYTVRVEIRLARKGARR